MKYQLSCSLKCKVTQDRQFVFDTLQEVYTFIEYGQKDDIHNIEIKEINECKNNYENIKTMTLDEMAKMLTEKQCQECGLCINNDWQNCNQEDCWCHRKNRYIKYKDWLLEEVE